MTRTSISISLKKSIKRIAYKLGASPSNFKPAASLDRYASLVYLAVESHLIGPPTLALVRNAKLTIGINQEALQTRKHWFSRHEIIYQNLRRLAFQGPRHSNGDHRRIDRASLSKMPQLVEALQSRTLEELEIGIDGFPLVLLEQCQGLRHLKLSPRFDRSKLTQAEAAKLSIDHSPTRKPSTTSLIETLAFGDERRSSEVLGVLVFLMQPHPPVDCAYLKYLDLGSLLYSSMAHLNKFFSRTFAPSLELMSLSIVNWDYAGKRHRKLIL